MSTIGQFRHISWQLKSNVMPQIRAFLKMANPQSNAKIKPIRSNNVLELSLKKEVVAHFFVQGPHSSNELCGNSTIKRWS